MVVALLAAVWLNVGRDLIPVPRPPASDLQAAQYATRAWLARLTTHNGIAASETLPAPVSLPFPPSISAQEMGYYGTQPSSALHFRNTWLLAYYHGEFGGALWQFKNDGSVGRMLLPAPTYGLIRYGDEVLAETGAASPFFLPPLRIHRFALKDGVWHEVGHTDFARNIVSLTSLKSGLYGAAQIAYNAFALVKLDLAGHMSELWRFPSPIAVRNIERSASGEFVIGARGYVIRLIPSGIGYVDRWYAPVDCVHYAVPSGDDTFDARCVGAPGVKSYERGVLRAIPYPQTSLDGNWMADSYGQALLHFENQHWISNTPPLKKNETLYRVENVGADAIALSSQSFWRWSAGRWNRLGTQGCGEYFSLASDSAWCLGNLQGQYAVTGITFEGLTKAVEPIHPVGAFLIGGLHQDAWFSERDVPFLGHVTINGAADEVTLKSPVSSLSRGDQRIWFTESDGLHWGFVDESDHLHEFALSTGRVLSIIGGHSGVWLRETFPESPRVLLQHVPQDGNILNRGASAVDVNATLIGADGSIWVQSSAWPVVLHVTEGGAITRYLLPCSDQHLRLSNAPNDGLWFSSKDPHCSGLILTNSVRVRDLPRVQRTEYM